jgi:hypothetical protein
MKHIESFTKFEKPMINEQMDLSYYLHLAGDVASIGLDLYPKTKGLGIWVDFVGFVAYCCEWATAKDEEEKTAFMICTLIQLGCLYLYGPMQVPAMSVKAAVKAHGLDVALKKGRISKKQLIELGQGLNSKWDVISKKVFQDLAEALKNDIVRKVLGAERCDKAYKYIRKFLYDPSTYKIRMKLAEGLADAGKPLVRPSGVLKAAKDLSVEEVVKKAWQMKNLGFEVKNGIALMKKMGFKKGTDFLLAFKPWSTFDDIYKFKAKILNITEDGVEVSLKVDDHWMEDLLENKWVQDSVEGVFKKRLTYTEFIHDAIIKPVYYFRGVVSRGLQTLVKILVSSSFLPDTPDTKKSPKKSDITQIKVPTLSPSDSANIVVDGGTFPMNPDSMFVGVDPGPIDVDNNKKDTLKKK